MCEFSYMKTCVNKKQKVPGQEVKKLRNFKKLRNVLIKFTKKCPFFHFKKCNKAMKDIVVRGEWPLLLSTWQTKLEDGKNCTGEQIDISETEGP